MKRFVGGALLSLFVLLPVRAAWGQDNVYYVKKDKPKEEIKLVGTIEEESPRGIRIKVRKDVLNIPAADVRQVGYKHPKIAVADFRAPHVKELRALDPKTSAKVRKQNLEAALELYQKLAPLVRDQANANRYVQFKIAQVTAQLARDDPGRMDAAVAGLTTYKNDFATGWEIAAALKLLARLLEARGDAVGAGKAYEELAAVPDVPPEVKQESDILVARMYLRGKKYAEAERKLQALAKTMASTDPQKPYIKVYLAQSQLAQNRLDKVKEQLTEAIKTSTEPNLRALAYNGLGDYYLGKGQPEEAFWSYLRVEVQYNQDREEEAKALFHLRTLFDKVKRDPIRARQCADKLLGKQFTGTAYQKQAFSEK